MYTAPKSIKETFMEFWDKEYDEIFLSMAGLADIWEGPLEGSSAGMGEGTGTILAIKIFGDKIFIAQGGGLQTTIKVLSPNGVQIYNLGSQLSLMTHTAQDVYGSMAIISEDELILGYMYINLKLLFMAPYGIDLAGMWRNPSVKVVPVRVSSSSWVVALRSGQEWRLMITKKESPEDCLPCKTKENASRDRTSFTCREESYSRNALVIDGYTASRDDMGSGNVSLSVTAMGGYGNMEAIRKPPTDDKKCLEAIDEYTVAFNRSKISPADVGEIGQKMSSNCSKVLFLNMLQIVEYKSESTALYNRYIKNFISGNSDNMELFNDSKKLIQLILPMLSELKDTSSDSELLRDIFSDEVWWAPIWFIANRIKLTAEVNLDTNAYTFIHNVEYEDFIAVLVAAANISSVDYQGIPLKMGWVIMAGKNQTPVKYGKESVTYYRFPFAICTSTRPLCKMGAFDFRSVCEIETRADGVLVWTWVDKSTLSNKQYIILRCYKVSNDGILSTLAEETIGYTMSPVEDSAKAVSVDPEYGYWIVRDYYIKDSTNGGIGFVESKVAIPQEMGELYNTSQVSAYANCNEMGGTEGSSTSTRKYSDGLLDRHWDKFDLDDDKIESLAWGNNGPQYRFVSGYTGYQIHSASEL